MRTKVRKFSQLYQESPLNSGKHNAYKSCIWFARLARLLGP